MQDDLIYYKQCTVQISAKDLSGVLPQEQSLRASLASFGDLWHFQLFCTRDQGDSSGQPNTAIIVFRNRASVKNTLDSSRNELGESFWRTDSVKAHTLKKTGALYEAFLMQIVPTLRQESRESQAGPPGLEDSGPPLKRPRSEDWGTTPNGSIPNSNHVSTLKSSQTSSATLESTEWMRMRITQLEAELDAAKASRDISISEQDIIRVAYEAEQQARREVMLQKCAAEAALSRGEVEQDRLHTLLNTL
ncbi:hypothetical protein FRC11_013718 [Ceratobasidium sp. 423]|nr:hypothetical protein FRC11_013718 [Ceratobasidium sp. 423]